MSRKNVIEIRTNDEEEYMDALVERVAQKLRDQIDSTSSTDRSITLGGPFGRPPEPHWIIQVSPTLKAMRVRGEVEFM